MAYTVVTFPVAGKTPGTVADVSTVLADQRQLNNTSSTTADRKLSVAAFDAVIPIPYGRVRVNALIANVAIWNNYWFFWCIWGRGPIQSIEQIYINETRWPNAAGGGGLILQPLGTDDQPVYFTLDGAFTYWYRFQYNDNTIRFREAAPGLAHSPVTYPLAALTGPPTINAIIIGLSVYDPRSPYQSVNDRTTWTYSRNAALCLGDFLRSTEYGAGLTVDENSLIVAADACDDGGRYVDLAIDRKAKLADWIATLQQAANVYLDPNGTSVKLTPDAWLPSVATFSHHSGTILGLGGETTEVRANLPTVVEIVYTNIAPADDRTGWTDAVVQIERDGVRDGTVPWRKSSVRMPWIQDEAQALREAYLRMNKMWLRTPTFTMRLMDEALEPEVGDPITLVYPDSGYTLIKVKVSSAKPTADGWEYGVFYDDPGAYVDDRIAEPTPPTDLPNPFAVPPVENLRARGVDGEAQFIFEWDAPANYPYTGAYPWTVTQVGGSPPAAEGGNNVPPDTDVQTGDLPTAQTYSITVWNRSVFGMVSVPTTILFYLDVDIFISAAACFTTPTLVNMAAMYRYSSGGTYWVTCMGDLWDDTYTSALDTYTSSLYVYHASGTSTLTTEAADSGAQQVNALWEGSTTTYAISGTASQYLELATTVPAWTRHADGYIGDGRFLRFSSETLLTSTQRVDALGCYTVTRGQNGGDPVPPAPPDCDPMFADVFMLLPLSSDLLDISVNASGVRGIATTAGDIVVIGGWLVAVAGTNRTVLLQPGGVVLPIPFTTEFCIEFTLNMPNVGTGGFGQVIFDCRPNSSSAGGLICTQYDGGFVLFDITTTNIMSTTGYMVANTDHQIAITRDSSNVLRLFCDGVLRGFVTDTSDYSSCVNMFIFGTTFNSANWMQNGGKMKDFRITLGDPRYTANYTPRIGPFPTFAC